MNFKSGRGGMFGSLRALVRGGSTRSVKGTGPTLRKAKSCSRLQPAPAAAKGKKSKKGRGAAGGGRDEDDDGSPLSQSSFFSGGTGEASMSSAASTPVAAGPASLSPLASSSNSHPNKTHGRGRSGGGRGGEETDSPSNSERSTNSARGGGGGGGGYYSDGDEREQPPLPPSYDSLVLAPRKGAFTEAGETAAPGRHDVGNGGNKKDKKKSIRSSRVRGSAPNDRSHILKKQTSRNGGGGGGGGGGISITSSSIKSRSKWSTHNHAHGQQTKNHRSSSVGRTGGGGGSSSSSSSSSSRRKAVPHLSPAERAAIRAAEEEGVNAVPQRRHQALEDISEDGEDDEHCPPPGEEQEKPRKHEFGVSETEKAYIRSLAEMDPDVRVENNRLRPLLSHLPRQPLYGWIPALHNAPDGSSTKRVATGYKKTLVLDLDETLVSSSRTPCDCDYKVVFKIHSGARPNNDGEGTFAANADAPSGCEDGGYGADEGGADDGVKEIHYYVRLRPGLEEFLKNVAEIYELVVWTASGQSYADAIIDLIDPTATLFSARLYRGSCIRHYNLCIKDLRRLGRPMNAVLLLDNYVYSFGLNLDNGVPISPWTGAKEAKESGLAAAYSLLRGVSRFPDVRVPLVTAFDLHRKVHGHRPAASTPPRVGGGAGRHHPQQRRRFQNPLSPVASVASCSAMSSCSSSSSASSSFSSRASSPRREGAEDDAATAAATPVVLFTGRSVSGTGAPPPSSRGVGAGPLSPVAAVWAANAEAKAEEERLQAERAALLQAKQLRCAAELRAERQRQEQQQLLQQQRQPRQLCEDGAKKPQATPERRAMSAKLAEQVKQAKLQASKQQQQQQQQQQQRRRQPEALRLQKLHQVAGAAAAGPIKRGTSGEEAGLSPVVARWAADAASRAEAEAKAARAAAARSSLME